MLLGLMSMMFLMEKALHDFLMELQQVQFFQIPRFIEHFEKHVPPTQNLLLRLQYAMQLCREKLWAQRFDICFLPRWDCDGWYALMLGFLSGARVRIGYGSAVNPLKAKNNADFDLFLNTGVAKSSDACARDRAQFFYAPRGGFDSAGYAQ